MVYLGFQLLLWSNKKQAKQVTFFNMGMPLRKLRVGLFVSIFFGPKKKGQKRISTAIPHAKNANKKNKISAIKNTYSKKY
ncbi:hypothetical protein B0A58_06005 [Flavobacterium branchiophilum NBRC 15030 = ATCC 35035]|nr:hypothetical protein B0A58_06005 [Flavobacterium branchiophilum NBRC 15030 = ATCC 35035]GEM55309.1 hypothetical protein FB1_15300 [Flavobacterium branchiophilum NBRC 15030 = ATCC 35035]